MVRPDGSQNSYSSQNSSSGDNDNPPQHQCSLAQRVSKDPMEALANHRVHQLSDIQEMSGSSRAATISRHASSMLDGTKEVSLTPHARARESSGTPSSGYATPTDKPLERRNSSKPLGSRATSALSLPLRDVPERRSSLSIFAQSLHGSQPTSLQDLPSWNIAQDSEKQRYIPNRKRSNSPVRHTVDKAAQSSEATRASRSRTFIRTTPPVDILDRGSVRHERVQLTARLPSPLFVGGGTIEGQIQLDIDGGQPRKGKSKAIYISKLSIDVIGVEEVYDGRRWIFLSLGSELFDERHPPPPLLVNSQVPAPGSELCWQLKASVVSIPFCINLPLNLGPPPYLSKLACIRYILCPSAHIKIGEKRSVVRQTWNIQMLTVHNPEKALASLSSPLLATDTLVLKRGVDVQTVKLTAGLHRQTWVNGGKIFIDIHVTNKSSKTVKKIDFQLEKTTLWYNHAAAGTAEKSARHLRLPKRSDTEIVRSTSIKKCSDWCGVSPHSSEIRTNELDVPRGHVTISTGRHFEIRYFVNVVVSLALFKSITVQLPVTLIPINSLDIPPNSLAQVAASIEAKRARAVPAQNTTSYHQQYHLGQAFSAPRRRSLDRARQENRARTDELSLLMQDVDQSPRRIAIHRQNSRNGRIASVTGFYNENRKPTDPSGLCSVHHSQQQISHCCCSSEHSQNCARPSTAISLPGANLPRLQVSTSGLGFSESEFEVPPDSPPRKVMLSEQERRMINQQRELNLQRQWSQKSRKNSSVDEKEVTADDRHRNGYHGWMNVAAHSKTASMHSENDRSGGASLQRHGSVTTDGSSRYTGRGPMRARSKTKPERSMSLGGPSRYRRRPRSMDRTSASVMSYNGSGISRRQGKVGRKLELNKSIGANY